MSGRATLTLLLVALPVVVGAAPRTLDESTRAVRFELPGKPTGPIAVDYRLAAVPTVGVPLTIAITARADGETAGLRLEASASEPRDVLLAVPMAVAARDGAQAWEVTVVPLAPDAGYVMVVVAGEIDGVTQARTVTIALRGSEAPPAAAAREGAGETLIALPVLETP
jgi:hypothetical protein